jgi:cellulose synthase/poly-beta-1,6-N-acetylglucosamine synthase-like glycosyltransferase
VDIFAFPDLILQILFPGLIVLFIISQSIYFINNLLVNGVIYRSSSNEIKAAEELCDHPTIHILIPVYKEQRQILEDTVDHLAEMEYPTAQLNLYLITEQDDEVVASYIGDFIQKASGSEFEIEQLTVDRSTIRSYVQEGTWDITGEGVPRTKASALKYAFRTLGLRPEDIVTVFDADTIVPEDTFRLAISGLKTYDIVQAKQTVRNHTSGWLPRLEAMGIAAWCNSIYTKTTKGPYQLLGKGYFLTVEDLWEIGDWQIDATTEDLTLGIDAYEAGYSLGIIDRYIQDICPADFNDWVSQKRRWAAGPYSYLGSDDFDFRELVRFWTYSASNQVISVVNVIGVPAGILYFVFVLAGFDLYNSPPLVIITIVNLLNWVYYSVKTYQATIHGVQFESRLERVKFYLSSNPISQLIYSMLWAIPISLAVWNYLFGDETREFHVTPKQTDTEVEMDSSYVDD